LPLQTARPRCRSVASRILVQRRGMISHLVPTSTSYGVSLWSTGHRSPPRSISC
jgi:hypothetical protein